MLINVFVHFIFYFGIVLFRIVGLCTVHPYIVCEWLFLNILNGKFGVENIFVFFARGNSSFEIFTLALFFLHFLYFCSFDWRGIAHAYALYNQ